LKTQEDSYHKYAKRALQGDKILSKIDSKSLGDRPSTGYSGSAVKHQKIHASEYKPFISKLRLSELGSKKDEILKTPISGRGRAKTAEKKTKVSSVIHMSKIAS
jgi:hypothetical protein